MSPVNTIDEIRTVVTAWAKETPLVKQIILFGSRARGDHQLESDIDLAVQVFPQEGITTGGTYFIYRSEWKQELEERLGREISLVHYDPNGKTEIQAKILAEGITIFSRADE